MTDVIGRLAIVGSAVVVAAALSGCGAGDVEARSLTHERAVKLFNAMETYPGATALDQAEEAERYGGVKIWVAKDTDQGREIVLAVTATRTDTWGQPLPPVTDCYRWTDHRDWDTADHVDCPTAVDVPAAPEPPTISLPDDVAHRLERALAGGSTPSQVRSRLSDLPNVDVNEDGGVLYVATGGTTGYSSGRAGHECEVAWREAGRVTTYRLTPKQNLDGVCDTQIAGYARSGDL